MLNDWLFDIFSDRPLLFLIFDSRVWLVTHTGLGIAAFSLTRTDVDYITILFGSLRNYFYLNPYELWHCFVSRNRQRSIFLQFRQFESQNYILFGNSSRHQLISNSIFCAVVLYPKLVIDNFNMDQIAVDPITILPACFD